MVKDQAGNWNLPSDIVVFELDETAPTVELEGPEGDVVISDFTMVFTWSEDLGPQGFTVAHVEVIVCSPEPALAIRNSHEFANDMNSHILTLIRSGLFKGANSALRCAVGLCLRPLQIHKFARICKKPKFAYSNPQFASTVFANMPTQVLLVQF